jgi:hypothetical protein
MRLHKNQTGGGERDRTDDLLRARQALSQLSYTPVFASEAVLSSPYLVMVGLDRVELSTSRLSGVRSNRTELQAQSKLSWIRIEPSTFPFFKRVALTKLSYRPRIFTSDLSASRNTHSF